MKRLIVQFMIFILLAVLFCSCEEKRELSLKPPSERPVYSVKVDDAAEIDLLRQQLHLDILKVEMHDVYFYADSKEILKQLTDMGYGEPQSRNADETYMLYGKVVGKYNEEEIKRSSVAVLNREKDHLVVYGSLANLKKLKTLGYVLVKPDYELRPREIEVTVKDQPEVQRINDMGVDIFTAVRDSGGGFTIHGSAFDLQIDSIKDMNYTVKIIKSRI